MVVLDPTWSRNRNSAVGPHLRPPHEPGFRQHAARYGQLGRAVGQSRPGGERGRDGQGVSHHRRTAGIDEKDIELTQHKDHLRIKGEKKQEQEEQGQVFHRMERTYGVFQRHIPFPQQVDTDKADATFKKGVLTITLPKLNDVQTGAKKITVKGGNK